MSDLLPLAVALGLPALALFAIWRWARGPRTLTNIHAKPDRPRSFGYKSTWLAVRSEDPRELVAALRAVDSRFRDATPCNWESGLARVYGALMSREVFVTPAVRGWVLAVGYTPDTHPSTSRQGDGAAALRAFESLGAALDRPVWFFGSHRGVDYVDWVVIDGGRATRAYAHADGTTYYDVGEITPDERALGLVFHDELGSGEDDDERSEHLPDESTVIALASRWTINPLDLEGLEPSTGTLVRLR